MGALPNGELADLPGDPPNFCDFGIGDPKATVDPFSDVMVPNGVSFCLANAGCFPEVPKGEIFFVVGVPVDLREETPNGETI